MNVLIAIIILTTQLQANYFEISELKEVVPSIHKSLESKCSICHEGWLSLNHFGKDWEDFDGSIEDLLRYDSDGDGFSNLDELEAGTFPGKNSSNPLSN
jgi:hypothetical protein